MHANPPYRRQFANQGDFVSVDVDGDGVTDGAAKAVRDATGAVVGTGDVKYTRSGGPLDPTIPHALAWALAAGVVALAWWAFAPGGAR